MQSQIEQIVEAARLDRQYRLNLSSHKLNDLPETIGNLPDLVHLNLRGNQLTDLPQNIGNLSSLDWLSLENNQLTNLPESICNISNLNKLSLDDNQILNLPEHIGNLTQLTYLNLRNNRLSTLPESIGSLSNLTWLALDGNQLNILPNSFSNLSNLTWLDLSDNPISDLSILQDLSNLQIVKISGVVLSRRYWTDFSKWKLEWLLDEDNKPIRKMLVQQFRHEEICNLRDLRTLELDDTQLTTLSENIGNLSNLITLNLGNNLLDDLPFGISKLDSLKKLIVCNNRLTVLPVHITHLYNLHELDISYNNLNTLPKTTVSLSSLTTLDLSGNPLTDLSILQRLPLLQSVNFFDLYLPRRYWTKFSDWKSEWLLDEDNVEIRRRLIEQIGYEKICEDLNTVKLDTWREYSLLKIDGVEQIYDDDDDEPIDTEPMVLLKMTCPSTAHIHILRVPPEMVSAEAAITWINHGIHPDRFSIQT